MNECLTCHRRVLVAGRQCYVCLDSGVGRPTFDAAIWPARGLSVNATEHMRGPTSSIAFHPSDYYRLPSAIREHASVEREPTSVPLDTPHGPRLTKAQRRRKKAEKARGA